MDDEMARKELITKNKISETAFALARAEGIENVTARKLAAQIGLFYISQYSGVYANMGELYFGKYIRGRSRPSAITMEITSQRWLHRLYTLDLPT